MTNLKELKNKRKENNKNFFFGEGNWKDTSNKYFKFKRILNENEIIIITNNVREINENLVLVIDNNKVIYLKKWQVEAIKAYNEEIYAYAVKLNKKYFKTYNFNNNFKDFFFLEEDTFEKLYELAQEQEVEDIAFSWGKWSIKKLV